MYKIRRNIGVPSIKKMREEDIPFEKKKNLVVKIR